jgi:hypothetical protein
MGVTTPGSNKNAPYWYFLTFTEINSQAYGITVVAFTQKYLGYRISTGSGGISSS